MSDGKTFWRRYASLAPVMVSVLTLGGCSVVDSLTGPSDSTPASPAQGAAAQAKAGTDTTAPYNAAQYNAAANATNTAALNASAAKPFPNLASVPQPPATGPTAAQRAAMTNDLAADRSHAIYEDNQVRDNSSNIASLVAQSQVPQNIPMQQIGRPNTQMRRVASAAPPAVGGSDQPRRMPVAPVRRLPLLGPAPSAAAPVAPTPPSAPVANDSGLLVGGALGVTAAPAAPDNDSGLTAGGALGGASSRATPQPQATQAPPPPPKLAPTPAISKSAPAPAQAPKAAANAMAATAPAPVPEQVGAVPAAPSLGASPAAAPTVATGGTSHLGSVKFTGAADVASGDPTVSSAASAYKAKGGKIRIVGFAPAASASGGDTTGGVLSGYQAALANAAAVKKALVAAGVPAGDIVTEAGSKPESAHADILLSH